MNFQEFKEYNKLRNSYWDKDNKLTPEFRFLELAGEIGEACNWLKKYIRNREGLVGGITLEEAKGEIKKELADIQICLNLCAMSLDIDLEEATIEKFNETSKKYNIPVLIPVSEKK